MIIDNDNFVGNHRQVTIPAAGDYDAHLSYGKFEEQGEFEAKSASGTYVVAFANCNDGGRKVIVEGKTVWKSRHGYLPGDLFGAMYFNAFLFALYFVVLMWYGITMKMHEDANIPIQNWVFATIAMGCLELFFKAGDMFVWNEDGSRFWVAFYVGTLLLSLIPSKFKCSFNYAILILHRRYYWCFETWYFQVFDCNAFFGMGSSP